jgi:hypothetical protein
MADRIAVTRSVSIDPAEIEESFVRASGPGGQNVNKVASAEATGGDQSHPRLAAAAAGGQVAALGHQADALESARGGVTAAQVTQCNFC